MQDLLPVLIALLAVVAAAGALAPRLGVPMPVLLAIAGFGLAFVPGLPRARLDPNLILLLFLPPLLYADAFVTSWVDFRRWLRPIMMLAVGLVAFTILVVGLVMHACLPELPWAVCFLLGAIVSPTDTVAVLAVIERLRVPRRLTAVLGGESLINDATGLVGVQLGIAVTLSGAFELGGVLLRFAWVAGGGAAIGALVGLLFAWLNRRARTKELLFVLSLVSPYVALFLAQSAGCSGVLAVVIAGFVVAWRIHQLPPQARVDLFTAWRLLTWVLNGMCFVFIGLETPHLVRETMGGGGYRVLWSGLLVSLAVILARVVWILPGAYVPLWLSQRQRERELGYPPWRGVLLASWCGVRGVISLAAALAVPATLAEDRPFPGRDVVLACSLIVILVTMFVQGLTMQPLVRLLGIREEADIAAELRSAREEILGAGIARLDAFCTERSCPLSVHHWRTVMADELTSLRDQDREARMQAGARLAVSREVRRAVGETQSQALLALRDQGRINDSTYLALQLELDREQSAVPGSTA